MTNTKKEKATKVNSPEKNDDSLHKKAGKSGRIRPRNYDLGNGIYRFSRTRMFHKKAIYKFLDKKTPKTVCHIILYMLFNIVFIYI